MAATINQETCVGCGSCVDACPVSAIKIENDKLKTYSNKIALQTDTLRYLSEAIKENAIGLANNLKKKGKTQLAKIAKSMYSLKTTIENLLKTREKSKQDEMENDK